MIPNLVFATTVVFLTLGFWLLEECDFLIPYRALLIGRYLQPILLSAAVLFLNLFALFYLLLRRLFLKDTGEKLRHVEKQLRTSSSISDELSARLREEGLR